jgi:hypothetical protein
VSGVRLAQGRAAFQSAGLAGVEVGVGDVAPAHPPRGLAQDAHGAPGGEQANQLGRDSQEHMLGLALLQGVRERRAGGAGASCCSSIRADNTRADASESFFSNAFRCGLTSLGSILRTAGGDTPRSPGSN